MGCLSAWYEFFPNGFWKELKEITLMSLPMIVTQFLWIFPTTMSLIFTGHLGHVELATVSLATSFVNTGGIAVIVGLSGACETLYGQTYGSANRSNLGTLTARGTILLFLSVAPSFGLYLNADWILLRVGQDPQVAKGCGEFLQVMILAISIFAVYTSLLKFLQCQDVVVPNMIISIISNAVCGLMLWAFTFKLDYGTRGAAWALTIYQAVQLLLTIGYIRVSGVYKNTWTGMSMNILLEWGQFLKLAYLGALMVLLLWYAFEVPTVLAGLLSTAQLSAQGIMCQIENLTFQVPLGTSIAVSIRVAQFLGDGNRDGAITTARMGVLANVFLGLVAGGLVGGLRFLLPRIFTNSPLVIEWTSSILIALAVTLTLSTTVEVCCGILRGSGKQEIGSIILGVTCVLTLIAGVPSMLLTDYGVIAFAWSFTGGNFLSLIFFLIALARVDWDMEVKKAYERTTQAVGESVEGKKEDEEETDKTELTTGNTKVSWPFIIITRILIVILYLGGFIAGIVCRCVIGQPDWSTILTNSTSVSLPYANASFPMTMNASLPSPTSMPGMANTTTLSGMDAWGDATTVPFWAAQTSVGTMMTMMSGAMMNGTMGGM